MECTRNAPNRTDTHSFRSFVSFTLVALLRLPNGVYHRMASKTHHNVTVIVIFSWNWNVCSCSPLFFFFFFFLFFNFLRVCHPNCSVFLFFICAIRILHICIAVLWRLYEKLRFGCHLVDNISESRQQKEHICIYKMNNMAPKTECSKQKTNSINKTWKILLV